MLINDSRFITPVRKKSMPTKEDIANAGKLHYAILKKTAFKKRWSHQAWAESFRLLREDTNAERVRAAVDWYAEAIGGQFVPVAYCAKTFRTKFLQIERAMMGDPQREVELTEKQLKILDEVMQAISHKPWPKGSKGALKKSVARSVVVYCDWVVRVRALSDAYASYPMLRTPQSAFAKEMRNAFKIGSTFLIRWYLRVLNQIQNWEDWTGDLRSFEFRDNHPVLNAHCAEMCTRFSGSALGWERFAKKLEKVEQ